MFAFMSMTDLHHGINSTLVTTPIYSYTDLIITIDCIISNSNHFGYSGFEEFNQFCRRIQEEVLNL